MTGFWFHVNSGCPLLGRDHDDHCRIRRHLPHVASWQGLIIVDTPSLLVWNTVYLSWLGRCVFKPKTISQLFLKPKQYLSWLGRCAPLPESSSSLFPSPSLLRSLSTHFFAKETVWKILLLFQNFEAFHMETNRKNRLRPNMFKISWLNVLHFIWKGLMLLELRWTRLERRNTRNVLEFVGWD